MTSGAAPPTDAARFLVTGTDGGLGKRIAARLRAGGHYVIESSRAAKPVLGGKREIPYLAWDMAQAPPFGFRTASTIIHCGGLTHFEPRTLREEQRFFEVNRDGMVRLTEVFGDRLRRVIFISTQAVFAAADLAAGADENTVPRPETAYGASKLEAEKILREATANTAIEGIVLRMPLLYGPAMRGNVGRLLQLVDRGFYRPPSGESPAKSILYVEDAGVAIIRALTGLPGGVYHVAPPVPVRIEDLVATARNVRGRRATHLSVPIPALRVIGAASDFLAARTPVRLPVTRRAVDVLTRPSVLVGRRFPELTGWAPETPLAAGVRATLEAAPPPLRP